MLTRGRDFSANSAGWFSTCCQHIPCRRRGRHARTRCAGAHPRKRRGSPPASDAAPVVAAKVRTATTGAASRVGRGTHSFPRVRPGAASERATATASPRSVPNARRKLARKSGRDHPSSRQHAECKLVCSNCDDRRRVTCWRCPPSFSRMRTGVASASVTAAAPARYVLTANRKLASRIG